MEDITGSLNGSGMNQVGWCCFIDPTSALSTWAPTASLSVCLSVWVCESYFLHHLPGTGVCCAPLTCVVHHRALCIMPTIVHDKNSDWTGNILFWPLYVRVLKVGSPSMSNCTCIWDVAKFWGLWVMWDLKLWMFFFVLPFTWLPSLGSCIRDEPLNIVGGGGGLLFFLGYTVAWICSLSQIADAICSKSLKKIQMLGFRVSF